MDHQFEVSVESGIGRRQVSGLPTSRNENCRYAKEREEPLDRGDCGPSI
jgi:hypothetical protein